MIYEVEGDIMLTRAQVIAQGVSTFDPMTRGIARKLHERYPVMVEEFNAWCEQERPEPGQLWLWGDTGQQQVLNLITHEGDEDPTRLRRPDKIAVHRCFRRLDRLVAEQRLPSIAMPPIAAGEFGLDWAEVRAMMHSQLGELLIPLFVYVKELDGQVAHEPGL